MKKKIFSILLIPSMLFAGIVQTSCFGEFALTRKVYEFNAGIGDDSMGGRAIRTLVMYALYFVPVYEIALFGDVVIFNLIEFWTGTNPLAMEEGEMEQQVIQYKGKDYLVTATKNQFQIMELNEGAEAMETILAFSENDKSWYLNETKLVTYKGQDKDNAAIFDYYTEAGCVETVLIPASGLSNRI